VVAVRVGVKDGVLVGAGVLDGAVNGVRDGLVVGLIVWVGPPPALTTRGVVTVCTRSMNKLTAKTTTRVRARPRASGWLSEYFLEIFMVRLPCPN
jgi:hypothetical protein